MKKVAVGRGKIAVERNKEICEMYNEGASLAKIARHFGISRQRVFQILGK